MFEHEPVEGEMDDAPQEHLQSIDDLIGEPAHKVQKSIAEDESIHVDTISHAVINLSGYLEADVVQDCQIILHPSGRYKISQENNQFEVVEAAA